MSYAPSLSVLRDMRARHGRRRRRHARCWRWAIPIWARRAPSRSIGAAVGSAADPGGGSAGARDRAPLRRAHRHVRVGAEAREAWLKQEAPRYRILHLATHGLLDDASPLYSQLVLAAPRDGERRRRPARGARDPRPQPPRRPGRPLRLRDGARPIGSGRGAHRRGLGLLRGRLSRHRGQPMEGRGGQHQPADDGLPPRAARGACARAGAAPGRPGPATAGQTSGTRSTGRASWPWGTRTPARSAAAPAPRRP